MRGGAGRGAVSMATYLCQSDSASLQIGKAQHTLSLHNVLLLIRTVTPEGLEEFIRLRSGVCVYSLWHERW